MGSRLGRAVRGPYWDATAAREQQDSIESGIPTGGRLSRGIGLAGKSWRVVVARPSLLVFPLIATVAQAAIFVTYIDRFVGFAHLTDHGKAGLYVRLYPLYVPLTLLSCWSSAVVMAVVDEQLRGNDVTWRHGVRAANRRLPALLGWALLSATVGVVLKVLQERASLVGRLVFGAVGIAWSAATALVVPALVLEGLGPVTGVRRSATLFRARWGEQLVGDGVIGLAVAFWTLPIVFFGFLSVFAFGSAVGIAILVVGLALAAAVGQTLSGVFQASMFRYASDGVLGPTFTEADFRSAMAFNRRRWRRRR